MSSRIPPRKMDELSLCFGLFNDRLRLVYELRSFLEPNSLSMKLYLSVEKVKRWRRLIDGIGKYRSHANINFNLEPI